MLSESLGGNSKTCLIITCSPHPFNDQETLSTCRFGKRARSIKNNAKVNREYTIPELRKLLEVSEKEIETYKMQIVVLETEIEKLGGIVPEGDVLLGKALAEKKRFEDLMDAAEEAEIAEKLAKEE